jgi:hypothetical protein
MSVVPALRAQLEKVRHQHVADLAAAAGWVELPFALARKLPHAGRGLASQWVFLASRLCVDRETRQRRRHHLHETVLQRAVREAMIATHLTKRIACHAFRHSSTTHLLEDGYDMRKVQELLGHEEVSTTMICAHVLDLGRQRCGVQRMRSGVSGAYRVPWGRCGRCLVSIKRGRTGAALNGGRGRVASGGTTDASHGRLDRSRPWTKGPGRARMSYTTKFERLTDPSISC